MTDKDNVSLVKRQYLQQVPPRRFQWPATIAAIQSDLWQDVFSPDIHRFPPGDRYTYLILRDFITRIGNEEIDERILEKYTTFLQYPPAVLHPTASTVITYSARDTEVYIAEQPSLLAAGGITGLRTWEASLLLSEWILTQDMKGKKVLELGAGTGLAGILAAKGGAFVTATDGSDEVVTRLQKNYELNSVQAETKSLWWGKTNGLLEERWDYILGADVTYDEDVCSSLAETFAAGLRRGGTGFVAATVRNEATVHAFVRECEARNLHVGNVQGWDRSKGVFFSYDLSPMRLLELSMRPQ